MRNLKWVVATLVTVLVPSLASAIIVAFRVGPDGDYATIQAGLDAALSGNGDALVEVEAGTYHENLSVTGAFTSGTVDVIGGWDPTFTDYSRDPAATVVNGDGIDRTVDLEPGGGTLILKEMTFTGGLATDGGGGGLKFAPVLSSDVELVHCVVSGNFVILPTNASGGGIEAYLAGTSRLQLVRCDVSDNTAYSTGSLAFGGGLDLWLTEESSAFIQGSRIESNTCQVTDSNGLGGGGIAVTAADYGELVLDDSVISGNHLHGGGVGTGAGGALSTEAGSTADQGLIIAERDRWVDNTSTSSAVEPQVFVSTIGQSHGLLSDSVISGGDGGGVEGYGYDSSELYLTNLTVAGNASTGVSLDEENSASVTLANSIVDLNDTDTLYAGAVGTIDDLVSVDPHFKDAGAGNYGVLADSPAIDQGSNTATGIGPMDVNRCARVQNGTVDEGASEQASIFCGGFELGGPFRWSATVG